MGLECWHDTLRQLARSPSNALDLGKAAEHLVCADLMLSGYRAFLSDQGLPYDVLVDFGGRILRLQVKAACFPKNVNMRGRTAREAYSWSVRRRGKTKTARLSAVDCDIVALVALDIRAVAYLPLALCGETVQLVPPGAKIATMFRTGGQWARPVDKFPFAEATSGDVDSYVGARREYTHCARGHEATPENLRWTKSGARVCRACSNASNRRTRAARAAAVEAVA